MKKLFLCAAALVALAPQAQAGGPGVPTGTWCEIEAASEAEGWMHFKRGKCPTDKYGVMYHKTLELKRNGDYILYNHAHELTCKVDPKSYFKGWADYACADMFGNTTKHNQKFVFDGRFLGLSTL